MQPKGYFSPFVYIWSIFFKVNWSNLKMLVTGDSRAAYIDMNHLENVPRHCFAVEDDATLQDIVRLIDQNISDELRVIFVIGFHKELTLTDTIVIDKKEIEVLKVNENPNFDSIIETIKTNVERWNAEFPNTKVIWGLPYPIDFMRYNLSCVKPSLASDLILQIPESVFREMTMKHHEKCKELLQRWRAELIKVPYYDLSESFFTNLKKKSIPFKELSLEYDMPESRTIDGLHASKEYVRWLAKHLICKMKTARVITTKELCKNEAGSVLKVDKKDITFSFCDLKDEDVVSVPLVV